VRDSPGGIEGILGIMRLRYKSPWMETADSLSDGSDSTKEESFARPAAATRSNGGRGADPGVFSNRLPEALRPLLLHVSRSGAISNDQSRQGVTLGRVK